MMEYVLLTAFGLGLFLCVISWLMVTVAGFRHHAIAGFISAIPVLNLLILPTIWHRAFKWFLIGIIGVMLIAGSWLGGFDKHSYNVAKDLGLDTKALGLAPPKPQFEANIPLESNEEAPVALSDVQELPSRALYRMSFKKIDTQAAPQYLNKFIRLERKDRKRMEGKLLDVSNHSIKIERNVQGGMIRHDIQLDDIASLEVLAPKE